MKLTSFLVALTAVALAACGEAPAEPDGPVQVRFVHTGSTVPPVTFLIDGQAASGASSLTRGTATAYTGSNAGEHQIVVRNAAADTTYATANVTFVEGQKYTVVVSGQRSATAAQNTVGLTVLLDGGVTPPSGQAGVRLFNSASLFRGTTGNVDVVYGAPTVTSANIGTTTRLGSNVAFRNTSGASFAYQGVAPGTVRFFGTAPTTGATTPNGTAIAGSSAAAGTALAAGRLYTVLLVDPPSPTGGQQGTILVLEDN